MASCRNKYQFGSILGLAKGDATIKTTKAVRFGKIAIAAVTKKENGGFSYLRCGYGKRKRVGEGHRQGGAGRKEQPGSRSASDGRAAQAHQRQRQFGRRNNEIHLAG